MWWVPVFVRNHWLYGCIKNTPTNFTIINKIVLLFSSSFIKSGKQHVKNRLMHRLLHFRSTFLFIFVGKTVNWMWTEHNYYMSFKTFNLTFGIDKQKCIQQQKLSRRHQTLCTLRDLQELIRSHCVLFLSSFFHLYFPLVVVIQFISFIFSLWYTGLVPVHMTVEAFAFQFFVSMLCMNKLFLYSHSYLAHNTQY